MKAWQLTTTGASPASISNQIGVHSLNCDRCARPAMIRLLTVSADTCQENENSQNKPTTGIPTYIELLYKKCIYTGRNESMMAVDNYCNLVSPGSRSSCRGAH